MRSALMALILPVALVVGAASAGAAEDAGHIKVSKGAVHIERAGQRLPGPVGSVVQQGDLVVTGADGSVGITFHDNSLLSVGPDSVLAIDRFVFDSTTHQGSFERLAEAGHARGGVRQAGQAVAEAMKVKTPAADSRRARDRVLRVGPARRKADALSEHGRTLVSLVPLALLVLAGCATRDDLYVLLPGKGNNPGALDGHQRRRAAHARSALCRRARRAPGSVSSDKSSESEVKATFGPALAALPARPACFCSTSSAGNDELTPESKQVDKVFAELARRPAPDIVVIGHTDRVGEPCRTTTRSSLAARRARARRCWSTRASPRSASQAAGRGKRELLGAHRGKRLRAAQPPRRDQRPLGSRRGPRPCARAAMSWSSDGLGARFERCTSPQAPRRPAIVTRHRGATAAPARAFSRAAAVELARAGSSPR